MNEYHVDAPAELDGAIDSFGHDADEQRPDGLENALVANVPLDMEESFADLRDQHGVPVRLLRPTFEQLFADADETLLLAVPFFEQSGLNGLLDEVAALARNDVDVRVFTRDVIDPKDTGYNHLKKKRSLAKLCDLYESDRRSPDASLSIRDFGDRMTSAEQASLQYRGIQQKMILADTDAAYIGSGEIREASVSPERRSRLPPH